MTIKIPELSLVTLVGISGSGKSSFARKHFLRTEIVSSDECRALVSDDENNQAATADAFELLHYIAAKRLKRGLLTVVDATNIQQEARQKLVELAKQYHCLPVAIVLDLPEKVCEARNKERPDRNFGGYVLRQQQSQLRRSLKHLKREGYRHIYVLKSEEEVSAVTEIVRDPLYNNKKHETGPFDIIGDIHGCYDELEELLQQLGYSIERVPEKGGNWGFSVTSPEGRRAIFLGDLVDRGPNSPQVLRLVMSMVKAGTALCVPGNHDLKLHKKLMGKDVQVKHGLAETMAQLEGEDPRFVSEVKEFLYSLVSHYVLDGGRLAVAHAGIREEMQGRGSGAVRAFCLYGETSGETDEFGLPLRYNWAAEYRGKAKVIYGHTPVPEAEWFNRTINIDTGCVYGGKLTALRYPEEELVSVPAREQYADPVRPLDWNQQKALSHQQAYDDLLDYEDVSGKRIVQTQLRHNITLREENTAAALEVMSRFAINPKWLIYLPPTMSPSETSSRAEYLEHPEEAIGYYMKKGVQQLVCEEKHMGSRAILVICKDEEAALRRFGVEGEGIGVCYTRTGRNMFNDPLLEQEFLQRVRDGLTKVGFWESFSTDWVCLDCELLPWSAKAQTLIRDQYAAVGAAAKGALAEVESVLRQAVEQRNIDGTEQLLAQVLQKQQQTHKYVQAYRHYCWPVQSVDDLKLAPFHILATEGAVHTDKPHTWHMEQIHALCKGNEQLLMATPYKVVDTSNGESVQAAIDWWTELTSKGGEGMVVKPLQFIPFGKGGLLQPAIKCRGSEYLRIIYGPEYDLAENLERLKNRGLTGKRSLALREFALGIEALQRFVAKEPLRVVHERVFGVLALESEEVDPRL